MSDIGKNWLEHCDCPRDKWEPIYSYGGDVLGQRCSICMRIVRWTGVCCFCEAPSDTIQWFVQRPYCSRDCRLQELEARKSNKLKEAQAAARAARAKQPSLLRLV